MKVEKSYIYFIKSKERLSNITRLGKKIILEKKFKKIIFYVFLVANSIKIFYF
jgi:hypothetical protein